MHNESKKILFAVLDIIRRKCDLTPQPTQLEIATREEMQKNLKEEATLMVSSNTFLRMFPFLYPKLKLIKLYENDAKAIGLNFKEELASVLGVLKEKHFLEDYILQNRTPNAKNPYYEIVLPDDFDKLHDQFVNAEGDKEPPVELFKENVVKPVFMHEIMAEVDKANAPIREWRHQEKLERQRAKNERILRSTKDKYVHALDTIIERLESYNDGRKDISIDHYYFNFEDTTDDVKMLLRFFEQQKARGCFQNVWKHSAIRTKFSFVGVDLEKLKMIHNEIEDKGKAITTDGVQKIETKKYPDIFDVGYDHLLNRKDANRPEEYRDSFTTQMHPEVHGAMINSSPTQHEAKGKYRLDGKKIEFDDEKAMLVVDGNECEMPLYKNEHCLCRVMFKSPKGTPVSWDEIYEVMCGMPPKNPKKNKRTVQDTVYSLKGRVQKHYNTLDAIMIWRNKGVIRNFGE